MSKNDFKSIEELVTFSKKSNLCMRWGCTTCGTLPFRHLVQEHLGLPRSSSLSLSPAESKYICEDLCKIENTIGDESIEFLLRWISVNIQPTDILEIWLSAGEREKRQLTDMAKVIVRNGTDG